MGGCYAHPITIGDNVWIGASAHAMGRVSIGKKSIIGAGSVVTRDMPDNVIAVRVRCNVIREITEQNGIHKHFIAEQLANTFALSVG